MILYFLLLLIALLIAAAAYTSRDAQKKAFLTAQTLELMENKYDLFVGAYLENNPLKNYNLPIDSLQLSKDALMHIDKEIKEIAQLLNANTRSIVHINYVAQFFPNLIELIESYYRVNQKNKGQALDGIAIQALKNSLLDAIGADIQNRVLQLDIGNL